MDYTTGTTATAGVPKALKLDDILKAAEKIKAMPKGKWMLVAPDGRVWADEDPQKLVLPLAAECGYGKFIPSEPLEAADPLDEPYSRTLGFFNVRYGR